MVSRQRYKQLDEIELKGIIKYYCDESSLCLDIIGTLATKEYDESEYLNVLKKYKEMKDQLKEIYHYVRLDCNQVGIDPWYEAFKKAIMDMYVHATAKSNTKNIQKLTDSIYDINSYATYALN